MMCPCGLYIIATFAVVVFGTSNNPVNVTYENYGLSLSTFSLLDGPGESETFDLGEFATMKFEFQTNIDVKDTITMEFSGFYNGYSALILCGEPIIESESEYVLSYDTLDDIAPHRDTMYLEFVGEVDWPTGTLFSITFNIMLISHKDYVVGDIYWFAAAMQYNHERADWVSDIAFELGPLPVVTGDVQMEIVEQPGSLLFNKGGSGMAEIEVKAPFFEVADFFFSAEVNSANPMFDDLCICGLSIIAASQSFLGCSADASLPEYALFVDPPYNETECKKKMLLDFGDLKKIGVTREDDTLKFFLVYRTDKDYDDSGNTLDELFLYSMRNHSGSVLTSLSGQVTVEPYTGSMNDVSTNKRIE